MQGPAHCFDVDDPLDFTTVLWRECRASAVSEPYSALFLHALKHHFENKTPQWVSDRNIS